MPAKAIMVQGTASNAGKSILVAALCRILKQDGYRVAPFKAQNMALNSYITHDGLEMGRAQVMQAQAAGLEPDVRMNPILLKPTSDMGSQVIVNGKAIGNRTAQQYWSNKKALRPVVAAAYESLSKEYDIIVIEGAGSPAEINLKQDDLVNMGMAKLAHAPVLLVGDIDRGGVFASLYGTVKLLDAEEQSYIQGLIINKFRGDLKILRPGLTQLEQLVRKPVLGVIPYIELDLDDEDSLSERFQKSPKRHAPIQIAVIRLPHISNFTDFRVLESMPDISVYYATRPEDLDNVDLIILPGTKSTIADLKWLRTQGLETKIIQLHAEGIPVFGICGGYQMIGYHIADPNGIESGGEIHGMNLLPVKTIFDTQKTTTQVTGQIEKLDGLFTGLSGIKTTGYEIHMGNTIRFDNAPPFQKLHRKNKVVLDGCYMQNAYGTYLHGIFDQPAVAQTLVHALLKKKGLNDIPQHTFDPLAYQEQQYDKLADMVRSSLNMEQIYQILEDYHA